MKITKEDYTLMSEALTKHIEKFSTSEIDSLLADYRESGTFENADVAFVWAVGYASGATRTVFGKGYNDNHVETALFKLFKGLNII